MHVRVKGKVLLKAFKLLCHKPCKLSIELDVANNRINLQAHSDIIKLELIDDIIVVDNNVEVVTVIFDMSWELLKSDEDIELVTDKSSMTITTESVTLVFNNIFEDPIEIGQIGDSVGIMNVDDIDYLSSLAINMSRHCKVLYEEVPRIVVSNNQAYFVLSDCALVFPITLPDSQIALSTIKELSLLSNRSNLSSKHIYKSMTHNNSYIYAYTQDNVALFNVQDNITTVSGSINSILVTLSDSCESTFEPILKELSLAASKVYSKGNVILQICNTGVCCSFTTRDLSSTCVIKYGTIVDDNTLVSIVCITDVLKLIMNMLRGLQFSVKSRGRYVCLETSRFQFLLTTGVQR